MNPQKLIKDLFLEALKQCSPIQAMRQAMRLEESRLTIDGQAFDVKDRPVYLLAVGKAAVPMWNAAAKILNNHIRGSLVITSGGEQLSACRADEILVADHPEPKQNSLKAGEKAVQFFRGIPRNALVLCLISGGTSSLMCLPPEGIPIEDVSQMYKLLNNSGATIQEINTVRKHCSQIKGGQMLQYLYPDIILIDLVISDVPENDLSIIGSGPTTCDLTTFQDAYHILLEYELWDMLPPKVQEHFEMGIDGQEIETVKPREDPLKAHYSYIISSAAKLANKISKVAEQKGFSCHVAEKVFNDDVEQVANFIGNEVLAHDTDFDFFIYYGESTVNVTGKGKGGRNQELALRGALQIAGQDNITWLSAGTDGRDGATDAAGAIVDSKTISKALEKGMDPQKYLANNDSYHFHEILGTLFKTGPTGNNLMDVVLVLKQWQGCKATK